MVVVVHHRRVAGGDDFAQIVSSVVDGLGEVPSPIKERDGLVRPQITHLLMGRQGTPEVIRGRIGQTRALSMDMA